MFSCSQSMRFDGFNPRTRVGCDKIHTQRYHRDDGFNPRTRVGCDRASSSSSLRQSVSIHAPAWGATAQAAKDNPAIVGFNPRTRVGCDHLVLSISHAVHCFNPRTRVGCDVTGNSETLGLTLFQSTHPRGVRRDAARPAGGNVTFQSTHPRGVRHTYCRLKTQYYLFQSTHPRGVRLATRWYTWNATIMFQSTHPRGVRPAATAHRSAGPWCFNPRTRVGCDKVQSQGYKRDDGFNPRTRVGCDHQKEFAQNGIRWFQSTHPRGVRRRKCSRSQSGKLCFNPRTRVGCDCFHVLSSRFP